MALRYAVANGNWSNTATWNGGTLPTIGDDVRANGFTVTIDQDINIERISTVASSPAVAGGSFVISTNQNLTCDIYGGTTTCLTSTAVITVNIFGNVYGSTTSVGAGINFTNAGSVINFTGNAFGGNNTVGNSGIAFSGTLNFTGNAFGGNNGFTAVGAISVSSGANLLFNGNITGGSLISGDRQNNDGVRTSGNCTINGNIYAGTGNNNHGLRVLAGTCIINSDCYGGNVGGSHAVSVTAATSVLVNGNIFSGLNSTSYGLQSSSTNVVISTVEFNNGIIPINGLVNFKNTAPTITVTKADGTTQQLVDPSTTDIPTPLDVRDGVTYASGALTGSLAVPPSGSVALGVPVDDGTGTAMISITDMGALLASYIV
jgi:hypothetical protein